MGNCVYSKDILNDAPALNVSDQVDLKLEQNIRRAEEENNLLQYKVEVLLNMLALEEHKSSILSKRLESAKVILFSQGLTDASISSAFANNQLSEMQSLRARLQDAIEKLHSEFSTSKRNLILKFTDSANRIVSHMDYNRFCQAILLCTKHLTSEQVELVALRFSEDTEVSVVDFLDFFTTSETLRIARTAVTTVRMSHTIKEKEKSTDQFTSESLNTSEIIKYWPKMREKLLINFPDINLNKELPIENIHEALWEIYKSFSETKKFSRSDIANAFSNKHGHVVDLAVFISDIDEIYSAMENHIANIPSTYFRSKSSIQYKDSRLDTEEPPIPHDVANHIKKSNLMTEPSFRLEDQSINKENTFRPELKSAESVQYSIINNLNASHNGYIKNPDNSESVASEADHDYDTFLKPTLTSSPRLKNKDNKQYEQAFQNVTN